MASDVETIVSQILVGAEASFDAADVEPDLRLLRDLFEAHPERRAEFVAQLLGLLRPTPGELPLERPGVIEILEFTMHRTRWPEVHQAVQELKSNSNDWRVQRAADRVLEAYADEWPTGEIYASYRDS